MKKIVILTGSTGNLGNLISKRLKNNKRIIPILVSSRKNVKGTHFVNFQSSNSIRRFFESIRKKYMVPGILINNATINTVSNFSDFVNNSEDDRIKKTFEINSISTVFFIKYFLKEFETKGTVINLLNRSSIFGGRRHIDYYSSKGAIYNASRSFAKDYKGCSFLNFMPGPLGKKRGQCNPEIIVNTIMRAILGKFKYSYKDIYFERRFDYIQVIVRNIMNIFKFSKNIAR